MRLAFPLLLVLISLFCIPLSMPSRASTEKITPTVIYGDDNRLDLYQVQNSQELALADSTVVLLEDSQLTKVGTRYDIAFKTFGQDFVLCPSEPFFDQPSPGFCSGSLVAEDLIVTAGHCITKQEECDNTKFVFGFGVKTAGVYPTSAHESEVVGCKAIIARQFNAKGADFSLIQLTRKITNHTPLAVERNSVLKAGDAIGVIGHPSGLPTKVAFGAEVRSTAGVGFFTANLDTYGGNSGSAVFNAKTGRIEGVLVRGDTDFVWQGSCRVSKVNTATGGRGEDVTKISEVAPLIP